MYSCTASTARYVQSRKWRRPSTSRTILGLDVCPWNFISMDLVGRLSKTSSGHEYALTVICMLTGYMFCIPLKTKTAEEIVDKYLTHVTFTFGNSRKILSDNGTEFKNALFEEVAKQLGVERKIYSPVYRPQANGCIGRLPQIPEGMHLQVYGEQSRVG